MTFRPVTIEDGRVVTHGAPVCANCGHVEEVHGRWRCLAADCQCRAFVTRGEKDREVRTFPEAARAIHLWLQEFCDPTLVYPAMIAEASRGAMREIETLRSRLATAETALADRDRHFMWDDRLRMEREAGDLATRLATAEAERDRLLRQIARVRACPCISGASCDELDTLYDLAAGRAPSTGTTPPEGSCR